MELTVISCQDGDIIGYMIGNRLTNADYIARYSLRSSLIHKTNLSFQSQSSYRNSQDPQTGPMIPATPTQKWAHSANRTSVENLRTTPARTKALLGETGHHTDKEELHPEHHRDADNKTKKSKTGSKAVAAYRKIDRTLQPIVEPIPLSNTYTRVFQWNDRDPDGWRTLPLSAGEPGEKWERIIFNRVGKCGSRSVINLIRDLAQRNHFNLISSIVYNKTHISAEWEEHIVSVLDEVATPYLYQRHLHYVSFEGHNASEVVYINVIRDPISRMVSQYYFARFGDGQIKVSTNSSRRTDEETNESIDECVKNDHKDCSVNRSFYIIPFFCGNLKRCTKPSRWALHRAIHNVQKHFIVVGILEEFDLTLRLFERMLPRFFAGATELYHTAGVATLQRFVILEEYDLTLSIFERMLPRFFAVALELYHTAEIQENVSRTSTSRKIPPSNETVAILRERMEYEYIFYNYVKDRLHKQAEILDS